MVNILIVDDDYADFLFIKDSLEEYVSSIKLDYGESFSKALEMLELNKYDVDFLILDYDLGVKKGDELYLQIKKIKDIPAVFLTGNLDPEVQESLNKLDVLAIMHKDNLNIEKLSKYISIFNFSKVLN